MVEDGRDAQSESRENLGPDLVQIFQRLRKLQFLLVRGSERERDKFLKVRDLSRFPS